MQNKELKEIIDRTDRLITAAKDLAAVLGCSRQEPIPLMEELRGSMKNLQKIYADNELCKEGE